MLIVLVCGGSISVSPLAFSDCNISKYGLYDTRSEASDTERTQSFHTWFCQNNFESYGEAKKGGASIGVGDLNIGYDEDRQNWKEFKSSYCNENTFNSTFRERTQEFVRTINPGVVETIRECLLREGLHARIELGSRPEVFRFFTIYRADSAKGFQTIKSFFSDGAKCRQSDRPGDTLKPGDKIDGAGVELLCTRTPKGINEGVDVIFAASRKVLWDTPKSLARIVDPRSFSPQQPPPNPCTSATQVVTALYKQLLERDPDPKELSYYVAKLADKQSNTRQLVNDFIHSQEYKVKFVKEKSESDIILALYKKVLARPDDPRANDADGFNHQVFDISKLGYDQVASNFVSSAEYEIKFGDRFAPSNPATKKYCN